MKIVSNKIIALIVVLLFTNFMYAEPTPPQPAAPPTGPVDLPVLDGVTLLIVIALTFGIYKIYKIKKASSLS
jgi:hypothetical protein